MQKQKLNFNFLEIIWVLIGIFLMIFSIDVLLLEYRQLQEVTPEIKVVQEMIENKKDITDTVEQENSNPQVIVDYSLLADDCVGWIYISDTNINYPIMQSSDNEYYLSHNINGEFTKYGSIFLDCGIDKDANWLIYGHNSKSKIMFSELKEFYKSNEYLLSHSIFLSKRNYNNNQLIPQEIVAMKIIEETNPLFDSCFNNIEEINKKLDVSIDENAQISILSTCYGKSGTNLRLIIILEQKSEVKSC